MRELKFRAWHKPSKTMYKVISIDQCGASQLSTEKATAGVCIQCQERKCRSPYVFGGDCELMQYTGLKDKNGKEIYEGDIVRFWDVDGIAFSTVVKWDKELARFLFYDGDEGFTAYPENDYEVIGNIHENP